jgi:hypothetical protein
MAGAGGAAGSVPDICHQPPGKHYTYPVTIAIITSLLVQQWLRQLYGLHMILGAQPKHFFLFDSMFIETCTRDIVHAS